MDKNYTITKTHHVKRCEWNAHERAVIKSKCKRRLRHTHTHATKEPHLFYTFQKSTGINRYTVCVCALCADENRACKLHEL